MALSARSCQLAEKSKKRGLAPPQSTFNADLHDLALTQFHDLEKWEKIARAMAGAIVRQKIYIDPDDQIVGRIYYANEIPAEREDPDLDDRTEPLAALRETIPYYDEMIENQLIPGMTGGHISWAWNELLRLGTVGMRAKLEAARSRAQDEKAVQFYCGALIMLDALQEWNDLHAARLREMGLTELADMCEKVPRFPAETFREAVQAFFMQHIVVMRENPFGGNSPGRLDYYLWPYLQRDMEAGRCTLEEARLLIDELFLRIDERIVQADGWVEALSVGGSHPDGSSAVNPLTYLMIESIMDLNITHPSVYVRLPEQPPEQLVALCAKYLHAGTNRAQVLSDRSIIHALTVSGVPYRDAVEYTCGGCMEIGLQGMTADFLYNGYFSLPKILELCITGGVCLKTGKKLCSVQLPGLAHYQNFEDFYHDFIRETERLQNTFFKAMDVYSQTAEHNRPSYLISTMVEDCVRLGRNMHGGGARYYDYGSTPIGLPNTADALTAIKLAVFEDHICTPAQLTDALYANFKGYESLRQKLRALPRYGQEDDRADQMMYDLCRDIAGIYSRCQNRFNGRGKLTVLTFIYGVEVAEKLGATADGNLAGAMVAQGVTPQSASMTKGITAAINSAVQVPFEMFNGGASTMWDLDSGWASDEVLRSLLMSFMDRGGQIYQGNTTDLETLYKAKEHPEDYYHVIVRVGGYSARFVNLSSALQEDVINRIRHGG